jgi:signal transduction histidine kinase
MSKQWEIIGNEGFRFFGKMNASISHEIKNVLAIINEISGLLEDLTSAAEKGAAIEPERLKALAGKIQQQIRRADGIVRNMNTFAHTVDEARKAVDVGEILAFMATLSGRLASTRGVEVQVILSEHPVTITTNPFLLENIVWLILDFAMGLADEKKTVRLIPEADEGGAIIRFTGLKALPAGQASRFPTDGENALVQALGGKIALDQEASEIILRLPETHEQ